MQSSGFLQFPLESFSHPRFEQNVIEFKQYFSGYMQVLSSGSIHASLLGLFAYPTYLQALELKAEEHLNPFKQLGKMQ